jgi:hypothetical protein
MMKSHLSSYDTHRLTSPPGIPTSSPRSNAYFSHPNHYDDQYSIAISFLPKQTISGADLLFGNDFDRPIRDRLPPGTNYAIRLVKWIIDPGLEGDAYADRPYMYGPALSSWNYFRVCGRVGGGADSTDTSTDSGGSDTDTDRDGEETGYEPVRELHEEVIEEGGEGDGARIRRRMGIPRQPARRKKFFLDEENRRAFQFEAGRLYKADFGNPYLVFNGKFFPSHP